MSVQPANVKPEASPTHTAPGIRSVLLSLTVFVLGLVGVGVLYCMWVLYAVDNAKFEARRTSSAHNLKSIALAMHAYHDEHGSFPRAHWTLPSGERIRSWRVALLPYLEQKDVFDAIQQDEPWNAEANQQAYRYRPSIYRMPLDQDRSDFDTDYLVITGPGTLFEDGRDMRMSACTDGPANTILAVEVLKSGVHWAEPRDLDIRTMILKINGGGAKGICSPWPGGAHVAFADGSVRFLDDKTLEANLRAMISRNGDELVNSDGVTPPKVLRGQ